MTNGTAIGPLDYDANGNLTNRSSAAMSFEYDDENRLAAVQVYYLDDFGVPQGFRTEFKYDGLGRLRRRDEYTPDSGVGPVQRRLAGNGWYFDHFVAYIYDGWRVIQERDTGNSPAVSYTRGTDLSGRLEGAGGIGGLLARSDGYSSGNWTSHNFYHADGNGNITYLVNSSQALAASYRYDPYGNMTSKSGSLADAKVYRFSSKELMFNLGWPLYALYYYGYRFYDPNPQRWLNRDPYRESGFETLLQGKANPLGDGPNLYSMVRNDTINHADLLGLTITYKCPNSARILAGKGSATGSSLNIQHSMTNGTAVGPLDYDANGNLTNRSSAAMSFEYHAFQRNGFKSQHSTFNHVMSVPCQSCQS